MRHASKTLTAAALIAAALQAAPASADFTMFGSNRKTWITHYDYSLSQSNVYVDTQPIQEGLEKIAQAMQEDLRQEYIDRIKKRYPELKRYGTTIGLHPDRAESTLFARTYGKAAYEKEIETRLTELHENAVIALNVARAARNEPPVSDAKELQSGRHSLRPFNAASLLGLINGVRHGHPDALGLIATLFDPEASKRMPGWMRDIQARRLLDALRVKTSADSRKMEGIHYDNVAASTDAILLHAKAWHAAASSDLDLTSIDPSYQKPPREVCDSARAVAESEYTGNIEKWNRRFRIAMQSRILATIASEYRRSFAGAEDQVKLRAGTFSEDEALARALELRRKHTDIRCPDGSQELLNPSAGPYEWKYVRCDIEDKYDDATPLTQTKVVVARDSVLILTKEAKFDIPLIPSPGQAHDLLPSEVELKANDRPFRYMSEYVRERMIDQSCGSYLGGGLGENPVPAFAARTEGTRTGKARAAASEARPVPAPRTAKTAR